MQTSVTDPDIPVFSPAASAAEWREALDRLPGAHPLQSWTWGEFKSRWGWTAAPMRLGIPQKDGPTQAAALVLKRRLRWLPFSMLYVPRGPVLDYTNGPLRRIVLAELEELGRIERAVFIKFDPEIAKSWGMEPERSSQVGSSFIEELIQRDWRYSTGQIQFRNTVELRLTRTEEELLSSMKQKTRYNIRLAGRRGITIRKGDVKDLPMIAGMYRQTAARDGFAIRSSEYYLDIWRAFLQDGMAQPLVAEYQGEPVAAVILVRSEDRVIYMYGASTNKERKRMPNYLLQWEAIRWAKSEGASTYDFWGAPDEFVDSDRLWGVWRFKAGFQGQVTRHIGAWDYPVRPFWYWCYNVIMPRLTRAARTVRRS